MAADVPGLAEGDVQDVPEDDQAPELEEEGGEDLADAGGAKQNRGEKKMRKAFSKMGLKSVPGIQQVVIRKNKNVLLSIDRPDVLKGNETYVVFGVAQMQDQQQMAQQSAAQQFTSMPGGFPGGVPPSASMPGGDAPPDLDDEDDAEVDASGLEGKDIDLVMQQANCSRAKAVSALKEHNGDIVNSIMSLTL